MTINNLMTGDLVVTNNDKMATVMKNTTIGDILRFHTDKDSFSYLNVRYNDDLTHKTCSGLTIVKVYRVDPDNIAPNKIGDLIANPEKMVEYGRVIYDSSTRSHRTSAITDYEQDTTVKDKPTIENLLTGDMLVHTGGKVSTVYKDTLFGDITRYHTEKNSFSYLYKFDNESLEHSANGEYDIIAVFRAQSEDNATVGDVIGNPTKMITPENLLWSMTDSFAGSYYYKGEALTFDYNYDTSDSADDDDEDDSWD